MLVLGAGARAGALRRIVSLMWMFSLGSQTSAREDGSRRALERKIPAAISNPHEKLSFFACLIDWVAVLVEVWARQSIQHSKLFRLAEGSCARWWFSRFATASVTLATAMRRFRRNFTWAFFGTIKLAQRIAATGRENSSISHDDV